MRQITVEIASPPEYEELVAEVEIDSSFVLVFSKEPGEEEISVEMFYIAASEYDAKEAGRSRKDERRMIQASELLRAIDQGIGAM